MTNKFALLVSALALALVVAILLASCMSVGARLFWRDQEMGGPSARPTPQQESHLYTVQTPIPPCDNCPCCYQPRTNCMWYVRGGCP